MPIWNHVNAKTLVSTRFKPKQEHHIWTFASKSPQNPGVSLCFIFPYLSHSFSPFFGGQKVRCSWRPSRRTSPTSAAALRRCAAWGGRSWAAQLATQIVASQWPWRQRLKKWRDARCSKKWVTNILVNGDHISAIFFDRGWISYESAMNQLALLNISMPN